MTTNMAHTIRTASFVGFLVFLAVCGGEGAAPPKWPQVYSVGGVLRLPYAEVNEGFMAYYDGVKNRSRIDYYGTVTTIQLAAKGKDYGKNYKVAPMTTYKMVNQLACFLVNGTAPAPVTTQSVLPDLTLYKLIGSDRQKGQACQLWQYIQVIGTKKNTYTVCINDRGAPVTYVMMGYDTLLGSHYDKYILEYDNLIVTKTLPDAKFNPPPTKTKCGDFPGPGAAEHRILMNPMAEYINRDEAHVDTLFEEFKQRHAPQYSHEAEEAQRKHFFRNNVRFVHSKNRANLGYSLKLNHLADRSDDEMKVMRGRLYTPGYNGGRPFDKSAYKLKDVPDEMDWRLYGAVTPVKDQGVCGSCWSFGTTGTIEGALFLKTGQRIRLSQQQLMDCSWGEGNNACDGGEDFRSYKWIMKNGGIATAASYGPYLMQDGYCKSKNATVATTVKGYVNVTAGDLQALKIALANHGPISVGIDASHRSLSFYADGVYYEPQCGNKPDDLDHAVLAVGYGVMNGQAYWLVKNSWSTYWGNDGYVLMSQKDNNCGVATAPTFVLL